MVRNRQYDAGHERGGHDQQAAVSQAEANYYSIETSLFDLEYQIREMENSLSSLLGEAPRSFERGTLDEQILPENLVVGIPAQMLSNRPDVKNAEYSLAQAFTTRPEPGRRSIRPSV